MSNENRKRIAWLLSSIMLFLGICTVYLSTYSSFVSLNLRKERVNREAYVENGTVSSYEEVCTTGMIYGSRNSILTVNRALFRNNFREARLAVPENTTTIKQFFYYITISTFFTPLFDQIQGIINYMHNQDGEK
ncbi:MAG: hypothetical protein IKW28_01225 [Lachnospiraceae bacterium]|nr:hypothetical protein [Lachnospiraceae bacterium]